MPHKESEMPMSIGIHDLALATSHHSLDLGNLADHYGIDPAKFRVGIGQDVMSVLASDEDIVTMAADATARILERNGTDGIRTLLFATESGIDQSKSAGVYVHKLVGLPSTVRVAELKQAEDKLAQAQADMAEASYKDARTQAEQSELDARLAEARVLTEKSQEQLNVLNTRITRLRKQLAEAQ